MDRKYIACYILPMNSSPTPHSVLKQIAQIHHMERGKLCLLREGPNGAYYNHQTWQGGKNVCRYVPQDRRTSWRFSKKPSLDMRSFSI